MPRAGAAIFLAAVLMLPVGWRVLAEEDVASSAGVNCTFRADPDQFLAAQARAFEAAHERAAKFNRVSVHAARQGLVAPGDIPRRSFIDAEIFDRMAQKGVMSARLSSDAEFFRRIHLDLTGRIPSPAAVREFLADTSDDKRNRVIDTLLYSPEFTDKWTVWLGDLVQNAQTLSNVNRQMVGRNAYHDWLRYSLADNKSLKDMAYELVAAGGNNYSRGSGAANYAVGAQTPMGPIQDTYDTYLYQTASRFLGLGHYDCLLCHDGRRHLDDISLWGKRSTRIDAQKMAAFFSRTRLTRVANQADPNFNSFEVSDVAAGNYALNTNFGNRPNRVPVGTVRALDPEYRIGGWTPRGSTWRAEFAEFMIQDPMLTRNLANRIWKQLFNLALAEPVDGLDPDRLDPKNPPAAPWTFQATHPELLEKLAQRLVETNYSLREFIRMVVESSAYQLSSRYDGEWKLDYVPLFARHYPRRLEGEEIHDALAKATGMPGNYTVQGFSEPVQWAMQLPEPVEPRSNGAVANFMNAFLRGNRDSQFRNQAGSILQQLNLMNDNFVISRVKVAASPPLRAVAGLAGNERAVEELFLLFNSRLPSEHERKQALDHLSRATTPAMRNAYIEDLAWACVNKLDFLFSY